MATRTDHDVYIPQHVVARMLGLSRGQVERLIASGAIGSRKLPGVRTLYRKADIERIARESVQPAKPNEDAAAHKPERAT